MRRAAKERIRTEREWRKHRSWHIRCIEEFISVRYVGLAADYWVGKAPAQLIMCPCDHQIGRFRKGQKAFGGRSFDEGKRYLTRQEMVSDLDMKEWLLGHHSTTAP